MGKNVLAVILGLCILAAAGADVYLYVTLAQTGKVTAYSESQSEDTSAADQNENDGQESDGTTSNVVTASMNGFSAGAQGTSENTETIENTAENEPDEQAAADDATEKEASNADYILPDSDKKYYKTKDLKKLTRQEVKLARNEIYARHGRKFTKDASVKKYFEGKSWYHATVDEVSDSELNKYEIANRDMIVKYEEKKKWR